MSSSATALSRIEILLLARLSGSTKPVGPAEIAEALVRLGTPAASRGEWRNRLGPLLAALEERGFIDARRHLTDAGRAALCRAFGTTRAPRWSEARDRYLPGLALGGDGTSKVAADGEKLQAAVAARHLGLEKGTTAGAVLDELVASHLGLPPGKVTMAQIRTHILSLRGVKARGNAKQMMSQIAARAVQARNGSAPELRATLVQRWLKGADNLSEPQHAELAPPSSQAPDHGLEAQRPDVAMQPQVHRRLPVAPHGPLDEQSFAAMVHDAIRAIGPEGRFGPYKVFVSAIWRELAHDPRRDGMTLDELKHRLLDANRTDRLSLARADLVDAMDRNEVATSEIYDRGASFHFVLDAQRMP